MELNIEIGGGLKLLDVCRRAGLRLGMGQVGLVDSRRWPACDE